MSKIEVNTVEPQCGTTLTVGESGGSVRTGSNNLQASDGGNLISQSGTTITLGASGDTIQLASGASQSGFGRSGSVNWQTGDIKTSNFTPANGEGYFVDTSSGVVTASLPAGSAGAIVAFADYTRNFGSNGLIVRPNGSEKIGGSANDASLNTEGQSATFVYVDATEGWINVQETSNSVSGVPPYIVASGGNTTITCGDFKTHIFTSPGTLTVSCAGSAAGSNGVEYLVVGGGGGGGAGCAGGSGGAGGMRLRTVCGSASPLNNPAPLQITAQAYSVVVGGGGPGVTSPVSGSSSAAGTVGNFSVFATITSAGGGFGAGGSPISPDGNVGGDGGSGGGGGHSSGNGGSGNTPPVSPSQGFDGGASAPAGDDRAGGGGGAAAASNPANNIGGAGSYIPTTFIGPTAPSYGETGPQGRFFAGGGGGSVRTSSASPGAGVGGLGGGGDGGTNGNGNAGVANTGGGGSGGARPGASNTGEAGGSGIVMIRYKFQN